MVSGQILPVLFDLGIKEIERCGEYSEARFYIWRYKFPSQVWQAFNALDVEEIYIGISLLVSLANWSLAMIYQIYARYSDSDKFRKVASES